jgi:hypothetical protein
VAEEPGLDVLRYERPLQQGIVTQIDLADREVVCGSPIGVEEPDLVVRESSL